MLRAAAVRLRDVFGALLFPSNCVLCHDSLLTRCSAFAGCESCLHAMERTRLGPHCATCSHPMGYETWAGAELRCGVCAAEPRPFLRATAFGSYEGLRPLLRRYKFDAMQSLAEPFGALLAQAILTHGELPEEIVVAPVPLHRRSRRPFNQSLLLAQAALPIVRRARTGTRFHLRPRTLRRNHQLDVVYGLTPKQRRENVRGAFEVRREVRGQHVLLIDDVYTTGATSSECSEVLIAAGATSVRVATLARAGLGQPQFWSPAEVTALARAARDRPIVRHIVRHMTNTGHG